MRNEVFTMPTTTRSHPTGAEAAARRTAEDISSQVNDLQSELKTLSQQVGNMAGKGFKQAQDQAAETYAQAEEAVRRNPAATVALAVGMGILLGLILRR